MQHGDSIFLKKNLIEVIEARLAAPAQIVPPPVEWDKLSSDDYMYQPVFIEGVFDHRVEQFWFVHHEKFGPGYQVITPFVIGEERIVMVNRGYIPASQQASATRQDGQISGKVRLEGLMVWPSERNVFEPPDEPDNNLWFVKDVNAMAENAGYEKNSWPIAPFFIDSQEKSLPQILLCNLSSILFQVELAIKIQVCLYSYTYDMIKCVVFSLNKKTNII